MKHVLTKTLGTKLSNTPNKGMKVHFCFQDLGTNLYWKPSRNQSTAIRVGAGSILIHELEAIKEALVFAKLKGWERIEVRTDSKLAAFILNNKIDYPWKAIVAYSDIKDLISYFKELTIFFVYRQCNQAADFMASYFKRVDKVIFESNFPYNLLELQRKIRGKS